MPRQRVGSDVARTLKVRFKNLEWDYYDLSVHYVSSFQKYISIELSPYKKIYFNRT